VSALATQRKNDLFATKLLEWWPRNRRKFSWRRRPTPYRILIAEQLLRKTSAKQVDAVYEGFLKRFGNPRDLAQANVRDIERAIRPLGIERRRAVTLHKFGLAVRQKFQGKIPLSRESLLTLPGVGEYATDAVRSLVVGDKVPMVDRNTVRVTSRVFSMDLPSNYRKAIRVVRAFMSPLAQKYGGADLNLGLLDFAAAVCTARSPRCPICIMRSFCDYVRNHPSSRPHSDLRED